MRYEGDNRQQGLYDHYMVGESMGLLDWLMANLHESRTKIKATLQGQGIKVNGKVVTQFDFQLEPGMKITVSKTKRNHLFKNHYIRMVYEDRYIVVLERNLVYSPCRQGTARSMSSRCWTIISGRVGNIVRHMSCTDSTVIRVG